MQKKLDEKIIDKILGLNLFDYGYYLKEYPDVRDSGVDALEHYLNVGFKEGRNPSRSFKIEDYINKNPEISQNNINPLIYYMEHELGEDIKFNENESIGKNSNGFSNDIKVIRELGLFDDDYYLKEYPDVRDCGVDALEHYLNVGFKEGRNPSKKFDTKFYLDSYPDVRDANVNPLVHYAVIGKDENRMPCKFDYSDISADVKVIRELGLFDDDYYLKEYPDVRDCGVDALEHYLNVGFKEGRNPSKKFDTKFYLDSYPDVRDANVNPLVHYAVIGKDENRSPNPWGGDALNNHSKLNKKFLTKDIIHNLEKNDEYYKDRWSYYEEVIDIISSLRNIDNILEIGPYKSPLIEGIDVIDITDRYMGEYPFKINKFYNHNCIETPYPIEDKKYDLVIACQVMEHLGMRGEQRRIFDEFERISNKVIISLPYKWFNPNMRDHHMIDEKMIDYWANNRKPVFQSFINHRIVRVYEF